MSIFLYPLFEQNTKNQKLGGVITKLCDVNP